MQESYYFIRCSNKSSYAEILLFLLDLVIRLVMQESYYFY